MWCGSTFSSSFANFEQKGQTPPNQFVFFDIFALSLLSVNSSIIQQRWANSVFKPNFLTNAEKRAFMMKRTKRLRRMVDHDHYDHDDLMISMLCDGAT